MLSLHSLAIIEFLVETLLFIHFDVVPFFLLLEDGGGDRVVSEVGLVVVFLMVLGDVSTDI